MDSNIKNINSIGWTIVGVIGGTAILTASAIMKLINNRKNVLNEKQKAIIGFSIMFSDFLKQGANNLKDETKKVEHFLKDKIANSGFKDLSFQLAELIKDKDFDSESFRQFYQKLSYSLRIQMFRVLVAYSKNKHEYKDLEFSLKEIAELLGLKSKDYQSVLAMNDPGLKSAYKILQLEENANIDEIKSSFRRLSKLYHPDKVEHLGEEFKKEAIQNFQKILDAYALVKNAGSVK